MRGSDIEAAARCSEYLMSRVILGTMVHPHVARQSTSTECRLHVDSFIPLEGIRSSRIIIEELEPHVAPVADHNCMWVGGRSRVPCASMVLHELAWAAVV